jgi:hypothetical protein
MMKKKVLLATNDVLTKNDRSNTSTKCSLSCKSQRSYPIVFKFAIVSLLAFNVIIFNSSSLFSKIYGFIMFLALLNGWASSENDTYEYCDIFLIVDALILGLYLLMLLSLFDENYQVFWIYSALVFMLYSLWNYLLIKRGNVDYKIQVSLKSYNKCNLIALIYSVFAFFALHFAINIEFVLVVQITGLFLWFVLLFKWYYEYYFANTKD